MRRRVATQAVGGSGVEAGSWVLPRLGDGRRREVRRPERERERERGETDRAAREDMERYF